MKRSMAEKTLLVLYSYHNRNTEKIAGAMAKVLEAAIRAPEQVKPEELPAYDLAGFGSASDDAKHHQSLLHFSPTSSLGPTTSEPSSSPPAACPRSVSARI